VLSALVKGNWAGRKKRCATSPPSKKRKGTLRGRGWVQTFDFRTQNLSEGRILCAKKSVKREIVKKRDDDSRKERQPGEFLLRRKEKGLLNIGMGQRGDCATLQSWHSAGSRAREGTRAFPVEGYCQRVRELNKPHALFEFSGGGDLGRSHGPLTGREQSMVRSAG